MSTQSTTTSLQSHGMTSDIQKPEVIQLSIGPRHVLIDLNKQHTNFYLEFEIRAASPEKEFDVLVVNQKQLDQQGVDQLKLRRVKHTVSGNIRADQNAYENYFLILKSDQVQDVQLVTNLTSIGAIQSDTKNILPVSTMVSQPSTTCTSWIQRVFGVSTWSELPQSRTFWITIGVILALVIVYFVFLKKSSNCRDVSNDDDHDDDGQSHVSSDDEDEKQFDDDDDGCIYQDVDDVNQQIDGGIENDIGIDDDVDAIIQKHTENNQTTRPSMRHVIRDYVSKVKSSSESNTSSSV